MMFGDARDRLTFFRLQLRARKRERGRGELCTIMEKDVGKPQVFFVVTCSARTASLDALK